ncbi:hypothetical protein [Alkalihalobacillus trypoxylicola]|nr:hypothetical protein [Alkalihalobacillus trypoxylicola]
MGGSVHAEDHFYKVHSATPHWMVFFKDTEDNTHSFMSEIQV